jgi:rubrerythrin
MAQLQATKTEANLHRSFAEEAQLNRSYLAYARQAEMEGYPQVSRLFRAIAESEAVHTNSALRVLGTIKETRENLQGAIAAETRVGQEIYADMVGTADQEGIRTARVAFDYARQVERIHTDLLRYTLEHIDDLPSGEYYVCPVCGNTVLGRAPDICPICGTPGSAWMRVV